MLCNYDYSCIILVHCVYAHSCTNNLISYVLYSEILLLLIHPWIRLLSPLVVLLLYLRDWINHTAKQFGYLLDIRKNIQDLVGTDKKYFCLFLWWGGNLARASSNHYAWLSSTYVLSPCAYVSCPFGVSL